MIVFNVRNVHCALPSAIYMMYNMPGIMHEEDSRNGKVIVCSEPVCTEYSHPRERVLFWPERDANPFFHMMESLWMLNGQKDLATVQRYVKRMSDFSDDGVTISGAYGFRWRRHFDFDQIIHIIGALKANRNDRRQVLQMWSPSDLLNQSEKKDIPCNLTISFRVVMGSLDMNVFNRSNDIVWGCYGANAVHMSMLHEFMARAIGVAVGTYRQLSMNWHGYVETLEPLKPLMEQSPLRSPEVPMTFWNPYENGQVAAFPLVTHTWQDWLNELDMFMAEGPNVGPYQDPFFKFVAAPMERAHMAWREGDKLTAMSHVMQIQATDWRMACEQWMKRRMK